MNNRRLRFFTIVGTAALLFLIGAIAHANSFPTQLNNWSAGRTISSAWANALEAKLGADGSATTTTLEYLLRHVNSLNPGHVHSFLVNAGNTGTAVTVDSAGKVGVATNTPGTLFSVHGSVNFRPGTSTMYSALNLPVVNATSTTASSTFANGIALSSGCFKGADGQCLRNGITLGSLSATAPLSYSNTTGVFSISLGAISPLSYNSSNGLFDISQANWNTSGYLSFADWNIFNNKVGSTSIDTSAKFLPLITDETGSGALVGATDPVFANNVTITNLLTVNGTGTSTFAGHLSGLGNLTIKGYAKFATTTTSMLNGTIYVDGVHYPQTDRGLQDAIDDCYDLKPHCRAVTPHTGTTTISTAVQLKNGVSIICGGWGTVLFLANGANTFPLQATAANDVQNITIKDCKIDINGANQTSNGWLALTAIKNVLIDRIYIANARTFGMLIQGDGDAITGNHSTNVTLQNSYFNGKTSTSDWIIFNAHDSNVLNNDWGSVSVAGPNYALSAGRGMRRTLISGNTFNFGATSTGMCGICLEDVDDVTIANNKVFYAGTNGIFVSTFISGFSVNRLQVIGNTTASSTNDGMALGGGNGDGFIYDSLITDNISYGNGRDGISINASFRNKISDNKVFNNNQALHGGPTGSGLRFSGGSPQNNEVTNNDVYDNQASSTQLWGIYSGNGDNFHITQGYMSGNLKGNFSVAGTNNLIAAHNGKNFGIGTTTPGTLFSLGGIANFHTATSTFYSTGGINLTGGGCFARNGVCISGGGGGSGTINSGTTNRLSYYSGATTLDSADFLTTDITNSFLGVGSSTPASQLSVHTTSWANTQQAQVTIWGVDNEATTTAFKIFDENNQPLFRVTSDVNLPGTGVTQVYGRLIINPSEVTNYTPERGMISMNAGSAGETGIYITADNDNPTKYPIRIVDEAGSDVFGIRSFGLNTASYETTLIGSTFGVNHTAPPSMLTIKGVTTSGGQAFEVTSSASSTILMALNSGNVGIGTTTPAERLSVQGNALIAATSTTGGLTATGTVRLTGLALAEGTPSALCLDANFTVKVNTGTADCTVSSIRYKENVYPQNPALSTIMALNPVIFHYKGQEGEHFGLIAEEVAEIDTRLVSYDAEGKPQSVRYDPITSRLVMAFQELYGKVMKLADAVTNHESRLKKLEKENGELKARLETLEQKINQ